MDLSRSSVSAQLRQSALGCCPAGSCFQHPRPLALGAHSRCSCSASCMSQPLCCQWLGKLVHTLLHVQRQALPSESCQLMHVPPPAVMRSSGVRCRMTRLSCYSQHSCVQQTTPWQTSTEGLRDSMQPIATHLSGMVPFNRFPASCNMPRWPQEPLVPNVAGIEPASVQKSDKLRTDTAFPSSSGELKL